MRNLNLAVLVLASAACAPEGMTGSGTGSEEATVTATGLGSPGMRGWTGRRARFRALDAQQLSEGAVTRVCVFGADGSSQPYAVLTVTSTSGGRTTELPAQYVEVPADTQLRVSYRLGVGNTFAASATEGCDVSRAQPLNNGRALAAGGYFTAIVLSYDDFFTRECANTPLPAGELSCAFYPRSNASLPAAPCAPKGVYVVQDGHRFNSSGVSLGGYRVVNVTANASQVASSQEANALSFYSHVSLRSSFDYRPLVNNTPMAICPSFETCDPNYLLRPVPENLRRFQCTESPSSPFRMATITNARLLDGTKPTTVYVIGRAGQFSEDGTRLLGNDISVIVAHDVTE